MRLKARYRLFKCRFNRNPFFYISSFFVVSIFLACLNLEFIAVFTNLCFFLFCMALGIMQDTVNFLIKFNEYLREVEFDHLNCIEILGNKLVPFIGKEEVEKILLAHNIKVLKRWDDFNHRNGPKKKKKRKKSKKVKKSKNPLPFLNPIGSPAYYDSIC